MRDWVELQPVLLAPCKGCGALWQPDESCLICEEVSLETDRHQLQPQDRSNQQAWQASDGNR